MTGGVDVGTAPRHSDGGWESGSLLLQSGAVTRESFLRRHQDAVFLTGVLALTLLVYLNSLRNGFIDFDDPENILDNYAIRGLSWVDIRHFFGTPLEFMYTPLVSLSYAVDYRLGGLHPGVYHATNLVLHLSNVVLVYLAFRRLTRTPFVARAVTLLFAVHPMNVDGVAWIATRSSLLSTFFFLGALVLYDRYARSGRRELLVLSVVAFACAALSKSPTVVLPLVLLLWDHQLGRRPRPRVLLEKVPYLVISLVIGIIGLHFRVDTTTTYHYSVLDRVFLVLSSMTVYLVKLVVPYPLSFAYAYPVPEHGHLPWWLYPSGLVLIPVIWALHRIGVPGRVLVLGFGFFAVTIVLSQSVLLVDNFRADRYAYLPYLGLLYVVGHLAEQAWQWARSRRQVLGATVLAAGAVLAVVSLAVTAAVRVGQWHDTLSITNDAISHEPGIPFLYNSRGIAEYQHGDLTAAQRDFTKAVTLDPSFSLGYYYLGVLRADAGDAKGAIAQYDLALSHSSGLVAAYTDRGKAELTLGDPAAAEQDLSTAIGMNAYAVDALYNRGIARFDQGHYADAITDYTAALRLKPDYADAYNNRGSAEFEQGMVQAAGEDFQKAIVLDPGYGDAYFNRGVVRMREGDRTAACADWRTASTLGASAAAASVAKNCSG